MAKLDGQGGGQRNPNGRDVEGNLPGMALDRPWLGGDRLGARMGEGRNDIARDGSGSTLHPSNDHISQSIHPHISESGGSNPLFVVKPQVRDPHLVGRRDGNNVALLMIVSTGDGPIHGGVAWRVESGDDSDPEPDAVGCRGARPRAGPRRRRTDDPIEGGRTTDEVAAEAEDQPRGHLLHCRCRRLRRGRGRRRCRRLRRGRGRRRCRRLRRGRGRRRCRRLRRGRGRWRRGAICRYPHHRRLDEPEGKRGALTDPVQKGPVRPRHVREGGLEHEGLEDVSGVDGVRADGAQLDGIHPRLERGVVRASDGIRRAGVERECPLRTDARDRERPRSTGPGICRSKGR